MKDFSMSDLELIMKESDARFAMIGRKAERQAEEYKKVIYPPTLMDRMRLFVTKNGSIFGDPASIDRLTKELESYRPHRIMMDRAQDGRDSFATMRMMGMPIIKSPHLRGIAADVMA